MFLSTKKCWFSWSLQIIDCDCDSAYGNAGQDNLWAALQTQADSENVILPATVKEIMDTWTFKMGFPYVTVIRNYQTGGAVVIQVWFNGIDNTLP
jgi:aminopeptidase N